MTESGSTFKDRELFGGALSVAVPEDFYDVSRLRQVPDSQEVFQQRDGMHNLIIDIMEYVGHIKDPLEAARYHLEDYVDGDGDLKIWNIQSVHFGGDLAEYPAVSLLATAPAKDGKITAIYLVLLRLEQHATDLLITTNIHGIPVDGAHDYETLLKESPNADIVLGRSITREVSTTLKIKDYGLFHPGEAQVGVPA